MDSFLNKVLSIFKNNLAPSLKAIYLFGSYGTEDFLPDSDVDLVICCDDGNKAYVEQKYQESISQIRQNPTFNKIILDCRFIWLPEITTLPVRMKQTARLLCGMDIFANIEQESDEAYLADCIHDSCSYIARMRYSHLNKLIYPLTYPSLDNEYFGYIQETNDKHFKHTPREFLNAQLYLHKFLLYVKYNIICPSKKSIFLVCSNYSLDAWCRHICDTYLLCHDKLKYQFPTSPKDKERLQEICKQTLAYENHFLLTLKQYWTSHKESLLQHNIQIKNDANHLEPTFSFSSPSIKNPSYPKSTKQIKFFIHVSI